jgi:hypothetical protein
MPQQAGVDDDASESIAHHRQDRYVVVWSDGRSPLGFGDELGDAIAYAAAAKQRGVQVEVWRTAVASMSAGERRVWPEVIV